MFIGENPKHMLTPVFANTHGYNRQETTRLSPLGTIKYMSPVMHHHVLQSIKKNEALLCVK